MAAVGMALGAGLTVGRRAAFVAALAGLAAGPLAAAPLPELRLGILQFGTVQWLADVIRRNGLDRANGFDLRTVTLANTDAGRVALMAGAADVVVSDWMFAAVQRAAGTQLCFAPFSAATGGIMAASDSPLHGFADLKGRKLGVAGGPVDKSWLIVQAAARRQGTDLAQAAQVIYGAPPLLNAKLQQGELDAVLTFWNFAARLEATGYREVIAVSDCARALGLPDRLSLVGFVFHEDWARQHRQAIDGLIAAADSAEDRLASSPAEWQQVRPLMDASDDRLFDRLRQRFVAGIAHPTAAEQQDAAARVFAVLLATGGPRATGGIGKLPDGIFWPPRE